jgi:predicted PurR-regulated permease PerM
MTRQQFFVVCFFAILLVLIYQIGVIFKPFLFPVLWAAILAHVAFPLHIRLTALLRGRETMSAALLTTGILAIVIVPMALLTTLLIQEAGSAYDAVNVWVQSGGVKR